jgi:hypothetical protein
MSRTRKLCKVAKLVSSGALVRNLKSRIFNVLRNQPMKMRFFALRSHSHSWLCATQTGSQDRQVDRIAVLLKELQAERAGINNAGFCGVAAFNAPDLEKLLPTALQICFHFFHIG